MSLTVAEERSNAYSIEDIIKIKDIDVVIKKCTNDNSARVLHYHICDYSKLKLGLLGAYSNVSVTFQRANMTDLENINFFIKSIPYNCKEQANCLKEDGIFMKEVNFFKKVIPNLTKNYVGEKWHPECYLAKEDALMMEDLRSHGYKMLNNLFDNIAMLKSALATLARFHGCSIVVEDQLNKGSERRVTLGEFFPIASKEMVFVRIGKAATCMMARNNLSCSLAKILGYKSDKIKKAYEQVFDIVKPSKDHWNVICHGGLRSNNLMFADGLPTSKCVLVDFQTARYAPMVTDLLQFLHLNCTQSFRKKYETDLLKFYYCELKKTIEENSTTDSVNIPTLEDIFKEMDDFRIFGLVIAALYFPIILIDSTTITKSTKDSDSYNNLMFGDQLASTLAYMKRNEFYKNRVEEAIVELAEKSEELYE